MEEKMRKKERFQFASIYAVLYTATTLLNSVLYLCSGIYEDPSGNWHELDRAIILLIGMTAFMLCTSLPVKPVILRYAIGYVWFTGFREPLAKTAYRDIWINFTSLFVLMCIANTVISVCKEKKKKST